VRISKQPLSLSLSLDSRGSVTPTPFPFSASFSVIFARGEYSCGEQTIERERETLDVSLRGGPRSPRGKWLQLASTCGLTYGSSADACCEFNVNV